ncbi:SMI1/KNR4 family protein [Streptomyces sp. NPDC002033]|uniref:SMI1/KNR4 family protein n=1 Tax=unclassified Streptomyces TaxID=2593676 RepID=UPI003333B730
MRGTDAVAALAELMPVTDGVDERVDWGEVEAVWGTRFPSDYVRFMEVYGAGAISETISILLPTPRVEGWPYQTDPGLQDETDVARETWEMLRDETDFDVDPESIVAWGVTSGADIYSWVTAGDDPERWPVLIFSRGNDVMRLVPLGMAEFLHRLLSDAAFREGKINIVLPDEASFVNWRNQ